jgi:hypothetical protein
MDALRALAIQSAGDLRTNKLTVGINRSENSWHPSDEVKNRDCNGNVTTSFCNVTKRSSDVG